MARLRRRWRVAKWAGLVVSALLVVAWWISASWDLRISRNYVDQTSPRAGFVRLESFSLHGGVFGFCLEGTEISLPTTVMNTWDWSFVKLKRKKTGVYWKPYWAFRKGTVAEEPGWAILNQPVVYASRMLAYYSSEVYIPVWGFFMLSAAPTAYIFWRDRRPPPHCCQSCGYDLTGNTSGTCSECGANA